MSNPTYTSFQQNLFCLNILSNVSASFYGLSEPEIKQNTISTLNGIFADSSIQALMGGEWKIVWGPSVFSKLIEKGADAGGYQPMNTMYIAQNGEQYVVAIAGTSAKSKMDWILEDFNVLTMVFWPHGVKLGFYPRITSATHYGLTHLTELKDPTTGKTALQFLQEQGAKNIAVTGHSLGGTLSPCYALYLYNNISDNSGITCMPVAGATPGNADFSTYYGDCLGNNTTRFWNQNDVVPHADAPALMALVTTLYGTYAPLIPTVKDDKIFMDLISAGIAFGNLHNLTHIQPDAPSFNLGLIEQTQPGCTLVTTNYFYQALFEHIDAYGYFFDLAAFQSAVGNNINTQWPNVTPRVKFQYFNEGSVQP